MELGGCSRTVFYGPSLGLLLILHVVRPATWGLQAGAKVGGKGEAALDYKWAKEAE